MTHVFICECQQVSRERLVIMRGELLDEKAIVGEITSEDHIYIVLSVNDDLWTADWCGQRATFFRI